MHRSAFAVAVAVAFVLSACQKHTGSNGPIINDANLVQVGQSAPRAIGDGEHQFTVHPDAPQGEEPSPQTGGAVAVTSPSAVAYLRTLSVTPALGALPEGEDTPLAHPGSLVLGFPAALLGESQIFGGVITKLDKPGDETLGRLKLIDLTPLHVRPRVLELDNGTFVLSLLGCADKCKETSAPSRLVDIPIVGTHKEKGEILVDLAALGEELNLVQMLDPVGSYTKMKTKSSQVVLFDYSLSTLVFDVEVAMLPLDADAPQEEVKFTVRWYLRLGTVFHSEFESRPATEGVGYFMTERVAAPKIHRFSLTPKIPGQAPIHYFVKNVPDTFKPAFAKAFDGWNATLKATAGGALIRYEFVDATDPRAALLVAGDPRYNIVEWDLDNLAPYGGLGPSIANQFTGEILTSNVLVQGPKIVELYTEWFKVASQAKALQAAGDDVAAETLIRDFARATARRENPARFARFEMSLGKLAMRVPAQMPAFEDPLFKRDDFEMIPPNMNYDSYMDGYFQELVAHELGHNVGLRHNFRGNLSYTGLSEGKVSSSIMEYLGRGFRHMNRIAAYDVMAIAYGYTGKAPTVLNGYCTDENVAEAKAKGNSPECSRDDATADPFGYFESRLQRVVDLTLNTGKPTASTWTLEDLEGPLTTAVNGLGLYALAAPETAKQWTNFWSVSGRPWFTSGVKSFVAKRIRSQLCARKVDAAVREKATTEDRQRTQTLINSVRGKVSAVLAPLGLGTRDIACQ